MTQEIISYLIIGAALARTIYSAYLFFRPQSTGCGSACGSSCAGCQLKDMHNRNLKFDKIN